MTRRVCCLVLWQLDTCWSFFGRGNLNWENPPTRLPYCAFSWPMVTVGSANSGLLVLDTTRKQAKWGSDSKSAISTQSMVFVSAPGKSWSDLFDDGLLYGIMNEKVLTPKLVFVTVFYYGKRNSRTRAWMVAKQWMWVYTNVSSMFICVQYKNHKDCSLKSSFLLLHFQLLFLWRETHIHEFSDFYLSHCRTYWSIYGVPGSLHHQSVQGYTREACKYIFQVSYGLLLLILRMVLSIILGHHGYW